MVRRVLRPRARLYSAPATSSRTALLLPNSLLSQFCAPHVIQPDPKYPRVLRAAAVPLHPQEGSAFSCVLVPEPTGLGGGARTEHRHGPCMKPLTGLMLTTPLSASNPGGRGEGGSGQGILLLNKSLGSSWSTDCSGRNAERVSGWMKTLPAPSPPASAHSQDVQTENRESWAGRISSYLAELIQIPTGTH